MADPPTETDAGAERAGAGTPEATDTPTDRPGAEETPETPTDDPDLLAARLDVLAEENRRLRAEYARARTARYRRTAIGFAVVGLLALAGAAVVPDQRTVLVALGGTGAFAAVLTWTLTPERFVAASVGEHVHRAHAANQAALCAELGLQDDRIYVPAEAEPAKLFVPQRPAFSIPEATDRLLLVPEDPDARGVAFVPTGAALYDDFRRSLAGEPADDPGGLATQLADAAVETFELADAASVAPDREGAAVAVRVDAPVFGDLDDRDHPVVSLLATGLAAGLDRPVAARVVDADRADAVVALEFVADSTPADEPTGDAPADEPTETDAPQE